MKVGIFTDSHYSSQEVTCGNRYNSRSLDKIREAYRFFARENCDLVVCLGDLIDREDTHEKEVRALEQVAAVLHASHIQTVCMMGNHDGFTFTEEEFYQILKSRKPTALCREGKTLLFPDTCYFDDGTHYAPGDTDWKNTFFPHMEVLEQELAAAQGDIYLFLHQNIDPAVRSDHRVCNADAINALIWQHGNVKAVFQGHYHAGKQSIHHAVRYITFPAMCENEHAYFIEEL